ncbi:hypothetical protein JCM19274_4596 [Algibacter lectus]|uniref:Glycosyl-hydrolase 97 C-terminal oligomerisation domain-containing protein n=1 Tax=Algibacter lectus TaxID=221126 RepID=A0A090X4N6_9FLAO|nr:glycoside hydrolase family 97 C-terminal domain-containing protein [Algibacter lectus]GAL78097.1 hypothetical protein JCM19274_4596 [Algibacter lectus]
MLDFSFLDKNQSYKAKLYTDDETIETRTHVKIEAIEVSNKSKLNLNVKSNNGFAMRITKL